MNATLLRAMAVIFSIATFTPGLGAADMAADSIPTDAQVAAADTAVHGVLRPDIYDMPYSATASYADWRRLLVNSSVLVAGGVSTLVILELLPEDATAWSRAEQKKHSMWDRYRQHFHRGPVWDRDKFVFNGLLHPYGGAAYYMSARSCGFNVWGSFLYSFCVSTLFWEYGVECFMEVPSVEDLVITPVVGSMFGEAFYVAKRAILARNYRVLGSRFIGQFLAFLIDPVNELVGYFRGYQNKWVRRHSKSSAENPLGANGIKFNLSPQIGPNFHGMTLTVNF